MGHSGSIDRPRRQNTNGALYGEPIASTPNNRQTEYTQAQLQALYLSRGRPDLAFMTNQSSTTPAVPEMQQTSTVKNHVNLKKSTLKLIRVSGSVEDSHTLEFCFDATKPCCVKIYVVAIESIDDETGCSTYTVAHQECEVITCDFPAGLDQKFILESTKFINVTNFTQSELIYNGDNPSTMFHFPLVISLEVRDAQIPQSQSTFATFAKKTNGDWIIKVLKQKIQVDGLTYELQEIYGIDGAVASAPRDVDAKAGSKGVGDGNESVDIPDGAECIVCLSEPRNTTVLPCRHMCLCGECAEALQKSNSTCPICRTRVEALLQIQVGEKGVEEKDDKENT